MSDTTRLASNAEPARLIAFTSTTPTMIYSLPSFSRLFVTLGFTLAVASVAHADPATLAKARAFIGPESAIKAVNSLRFTGELEVVEPGSPTPGGARLEIIFQRPDRQIITATNENQTETTALDGYDAWQRITDRADASRWRVNLLGPDQIKRLRANTFENLAFYRGIETRGGRIEDRGSVSIDGVACRKLAFVYEPGIAFIRSFDTATGRLILTETDGGTRIREQGDLRSGGLRFPKIIETVNTLSDGGERTIRVTFHSVEVNPAIDDSIFAVPTLRE